MGESVSDFSSGDLRRNRQCIDQLRPGDNAGANSRMEVLHPTAATPMRSGSRRAEHCATILRDLRISDAGRIKACRRRSALSGAVLIVEMKGDGNWQPEYREQAADYARRLFWFHRYCGEDGVRVHTVLVNYGHGESADERDFLTTTRIEHLAEIMKRFDRPEIAEPLPLDKFLSEDACQPSPSLVQAVHGYFSQPRFLESNA